MDMCVLILNYLFLFSCSMFYIDIYFNSQKLKSHSAPIFLVIMLADIPLL